MATSDVTATDGIRIRAYESGKPDGPTVLCVHGYPDDHRMWDGVAASLGERYRVLRYDVRGAGESETPLGRTPYRLDQLADDLARVVDVLSPDRPVHLLAHDWGSIQGWHAVTDSRGMRRIASFTSISGPCLDHAAHWFRSRLRRPRDGGLRELAVQLVSSWYILFFQLPLVPELCWRSGVTKRLLSWLERGSHSDPSISDAISGLALYRANMVPRLSRPRQRTTEIPTQVLAPKGDRFVSVPLQTEIGHWASDLRVRSLPGGHWLPRTNPDIVAHYAEELIEDSESRLT